MHTTVSTKGRIVIPAPIRRKLGIKPGTRIYIQTDDSNHCIALTRITRDFISRICGKYKGKPLMKALMAEKKREREM